MAWLKKKVQGHLDSFRGEKKSGSYDKMNIEVTVQGPDDELHLSDLESSITSTHGDFKKLLQQQQKELEEATAKPHAKSKSKTHRRGRSDGTIFIKQKNKNVNSALLIGNNLLEQMENKGSNKSLEHTGSMSDMNSQREFTNISFMSDLNKEAEENIDEMLKKWQWFKTTIEQSHKNTENSILQRKEVLISLINDYADDIQMKLNKKYTDHLTQAEKVIETLESAKNENADTSDMTKVLDNLPPIPMNPLPEISNHSMEKLKENVAELFGKFQTITTKRGSIATTSGITTSPIKCAEQSEDTVKEMDSEHHFMSRPDYIGKISCKTSKDFRECGITDMAFTKDKQIIVVDKHNKMVKVFDTNGTFNKYIGKNVLKDPTRVTYCAWSNTMLISDNETKTITNFNSDGAVLGSFAEDLSSPVGHCIMPNEQIAVINFDTKLVTIYNTDVQDGYKKLRSFPTGLDCPAYITCTNSGNLVISDWSANKIRMYNTDGKFLQQISKTGSGQGEISKPQGVHGDQHGNLFLGEKGNRRVQIFDEEGKSTFIMDKKTYDLGLPMAMDTTIDGFLIIAEYQGFVKFFRYLDMPIIDPIIVRPNTCKGRGIAVVSPEIKEVAESKI